jgi:hypothetical protein
MKLGNMYSKLGHIIYLKNKISLHYPEILRNGEMNLFQIPGKNSPEMELYHHLRHLTRIFQENISL